MTKRDYVQIAALIHSADFGPIEPVEVWHVQADRRLKLAQAFADVAQLENPRFDRARFIGAAMNGSNADGLLSYAK
jgi:hypothetical protein